MKKENLSKMLLTLGILSSMTEKQLEVVRERYDVDKIEQEMVRLGNTFDGMTEEASLELAYELLGDNFPESRRLSETPQDAAQPT